MRMRSQVVKPVEQFQTLEVVPKEILGTELTRTNIGVQWDLSVNSKGGREPKETHPGGGDLYEMKAEISAF